MNTLAHLLYEYIQNYRLSGFVDRKAMDCALYDRIHTRSVLKRELSAGRPEILEEYESACEKVQELEQEAMFLAALALARELR